MEVKARELESRMLLSLEAAIRGFRVFLGNRGAIQKGIKAKLLLPGIYFDKSMMVNQEELFEMFIKKRFVVVSLDEEGGLLDQSYEKFLSFRSTQKTVDMASGIFCWGALDQNAWVKAYPGAAHKIHATGCPRIDFWRSDFHGYHQKQASSIKQRYGDFVLVSSNFALANSFMTTEERVEQGKKHGSICNGDDEYLMRRTIKDSKKMFLCFVELINFIADQHKDTQFVVRPHPSEKITGWQNSMTKKNVHVVFEGGISPWVRASIAILHNGCTTGMEAYVTGVPAIAYIPFSSPVNREIPNNLSLKCSTKQDVSEIIHRIKKDGPVKDHITEENDALIKQRLTNVNGSPAVANIVEKLSKLDIPSSTPPMKAGFSGRKIAGITTLLRFYNYIWGIETRSMRKFPSLKMAELEKIKEYSSFIFKEYSKCEIKHFYGDVFVIEKKQAE